MEKNVQRVWYRDDLRSFCIRNNYYNAGSGRDYELILNFVEKVAPTEANIWIVAQDLLDHTRGHNDLTASDIAKRIDAQIVYRIPLVEWEQRTIL